LSVTDAKIIQVALNGLDNILKLGAAEGKRTNGPNPYAIMIEECYGLDKIEYLQSHENIEIYQKAFHLIETYFGVDDEENLPAVKDLFIYLNIYLFIYLFNSNKVNLVHLSLVRQQILLHQLSTDKSIQVVNQVNSSFKQNRMTIRRTYIFFLLNLKNVFFSFSLNLLSS
jgi:hypothetical protein